jgi:predicted ATPase/class 3 adenylate cyclase/DNA-binding CsgD family transcriptional regulator
MTDLPTGIVTFLFTDIAGSTRLWEQHPHAMAGALARHDAILRQAIDTQAGVVYTVIGDAFRAAFPTAPMACAAALAAQRALTSEAWEVVGALPVRMALHTCAAVPEDGDYRTGALNRLGRLLGVVHGGQIVLSRSTADLAYETLPPDVTLRDLGEHHLRDLRPEHIFQLVSPNMPADFPPLKTLDRHPHNLPLQPTALIGRENELVTICGLLHRTDVWLVTLTGPGGTGKTRLALQVAAEFLADVADGIWFVNLAPISDPTLVAATVAQTLGIKEQAGRALSDSLKDWLREKQLLLLLDNFEQVVEAAPLVSELLAAAPGLNVLATSRIPLHLSGEREFAVAPLGLPPRSNATQHTASTALGRTNENRTLDPSVAAVAELTQYAAVQLFIERAQAVKADFAVTNANAPAVAEICYQLDGLPLAIELAAARIKLFSPQALLTRLSSRLKLLTGGARDLPERQQTIRTTIDWSYQLLDADEQRLFARLGVFVGGCALEAAEAVCTVEGDRGSDVLDGLSTLVDQSLLRQQEGSAGESRFVMLETIRVYALERLAEFGEAAALRRAHAAHYLALAEMAESHLEGPQQQAWLTKLEADHDNLRAAIQWEVERRNTEAALRFGVALWSFWWKHGYLSEGQNRLEAILALPEARPATAARSTLRASVLLGAGCLANDQADYRAARAYCEESQTIWQALGDQRGVARSLAVLGQIEIDRDDYPAARAVLDQSLALSQALGDKQGAAKALELLSWTARGQGDYRVARELAEQSLALSQESGDTHAIALSLEDLGWATLSSDPEQAGQFFAQSLPLFQELGDKQGMSTALNGLGCVAIMIGNFDEAEARFVETLDLRRAISDRRGYLAVLINLGNVALMQGDSARSRIYFYESLMGVRALDYPAGISGGLEGLAGAATLAGKAERAAQLLGAGEILREAIGFVNDPDGQFVLDRTIERTRAQLSEEVFATAWAAGRSMPVEQAIACALEPMPEVAPPTAPQSAQPTTPTGAYQAGLTRREVEVLRLVAQGLTDAQVAERLVVSAHTVHAHLRSIYAKLEVTSRAAATRFAVDHHLV